jgi:hypothetical protein
MLKSIEGREKEGDIMVAEAYDLQSRIPFQSKKLIHVLIDEEVI